MVAVRSGTTSTVKGGVKLAPAKRDNLTHAVRRLHYRGGVGGPCYLLLNLPGCALFGGTGLEGHKP